MGGIVDTGIFIYGERRNWTAHRTLIEVESALPRQPVFLSSIVLAELVQGIYRAQTGLQTDQRRTFMLDILKALPVLSFTQSTAWIAGQIRGEQAKPGNSLPLADSLIAATALELEYAVLTLNVKDFARIPNLRVIPFTLT